MNTRHQYRSTGQEPRLVRRLDFDRLPPAVQERLVRCLGEGGAPAPLLSEKSLLPSKIPFSPRFYTWLGITGGALELMLWFSHFGDLKSNIALQPGYFVVAHSLAASLVCLSVFVWAAFRRSKSVGSPYPAGRYLFALDLVETDGRLLSVTSLDSLRTMEIREHNEKTTFELVFRDGASITLPVLGEGALASAKHAESEINVAARLVLPDAQPKLERIDPFFELRVALDWASAEARASDERSLPAFRALVAMALGASVLLGPALLWARNFMSDESMFSQIREQAETGGQDEFERAVFDYKSRGKRHKNEVDEVAYWRAQKTIESLSHFLYDFPESQYAEAADDALFEKAKSIGTITSWGLYLGAKGKRHIDEADDALFAEVKKQKTAYAYQQYIDLHGTRHKDEIQKELLPEKEIADAFKARDILQLLEIIKRYPDEPWPEAARNACHRIYQDQKRAAAHRSPSGSNDIEDFFVPLLAHAERLLDPHVVLVVEAEPPEEIAKTDARMARDYGARYHNAAPYLDPNRLRSTRGAVEEEIIKGMRDVFGGSLVLVTNTNEAKRDWPKITAKLPTADGNIHFFADPGSDIYCDVRLKLWLSVWLPAENNWRTLSFTSERAHFNPNVFGMTARILKTIQPGDEYTNMLKDAPASLGEQFTKDLRGTR